MKKVLFLHGFTSSGECEIARTLRSELEGVAEVVAPDYAVASLQGNESSKGYV